MMLFVVAPTKSKTISMRGDLLPVSAASLPALFPEILCNFYLVKNHKIAKNSTTTTARAK
jgi:hypothetical protein